MSERTVLSIIELPRPWPIKHPETELHSDTTFRLIANPQGKLGVDLAGSITWFQPIQLEGEGIVLITIRWAADKVRLSIGSKELSIDSLCTKVVAIKTRERPDFAYPDLLIQPSKGQSSAEKLFLGILVDIGKKLQSGSSYDVLKTTGLLRQLFLDQEPLVNTVNRKYRLKLKYETLPSNCMQAVEGLLIQFIDPDPSRFPESPAVERPIEGFLKFNCLYIEGEFISIKDVILTCAHLKGGIHFGDPKYAIEKAIFQHDKSTVVGGKEPSLRLIEGIGRVAMLGLLPLVDAIYNQT